MIRRATVVQNSGRLMGEVVRTEACQQCRACQFGQKERMLMELPPGDFRPGDVVEIELSEKKFTQASIIAYALPVALLFVGLIVSSLLDATEAVQAASALGMLLVGLGIIKLLDKRIRRSGFAPRIHPCEKED